MMNSQAITSLRSTFFSMWLPILAISIIVISDLFTGIAYAQEVEPGVVMTPGGAVNSVVAGPNDFGQALINFVTYGSYEAADKNAPSMLGTIARVMCALALFMMGVLTVVGGATYVIQTANKGVPGGQVISSFWTPLRISVATILLIPFPGGPGFGTIQMGTTKVAEAGNAHGGWLMNAGIDHFVHYGAYSPPAMRDSSHIATALVGSEMCMLHVNTAQKKTVVSREYSVVGEKHFLSYNYHDQARKKGLRHVPNFCGGVELVIPKSRELTALGDLAVTVGRYGTLGTVDMRANKERIASQYISSNYQNVITRTADQARGIAQLLASDSAALAQLQSGQTSVENFEASNATAQVAGAEAGARLRSLQNNLNTELQRLVATAVHHGRSDENNDWAEDIKALGWTALGTMYWQQSNDQKMINSIAGTLTPTAMPSELTGDFTNDKRFQDLQVRFGDMVVASRKIVPTGTTQFGQILSISDAGGDGEGWFKSWLSSATQQIMLSMVTDENADFVNQMQSTGQNITSVVDLTIHAAIVATGAVKGAEVAGKFLIERTTDVAGGIPFIGKAITGGASVVGAAAMVPLTAAAHIFTEYAQYARQLLLPLVIAGFLLAVVLPTIPLFFWLMGVVSWILFYIECMLVSPFWLAAHGTAEKEGWGTEHTRQGYMLMIGLYLNPILRVAGFFAIMVVLLPLGVLVYWLSSYLQGVLAGGFLISPFTLVGAMLVLAFFAYSVAVRVFSLPNELFERGLRWINGGQEVTGDEGGTHRINAMMATFNQKGENVRRTMVPGMMNPPTEQAPNAPSNTPKG